MLVYDSIDRAQSGGLGEDPFTGATLQAQCTAPQLIGGVMQLANFTGLLVDTDITHPIC